MNWWDTLLRECNKAMVKGGEVHIQFHLRKNKNGVRTKSIPIIRTYPKNQIICEEIEIEDDD